MDIIIKFNEAAFRHGISKEDILHALETKIIDHQIDGYPEKYVVIGFDCAQNPIEVMYNPIDNDSINVFHVMKVRNSTLKILGL